ncbi:hypothetical protein [Paenibacillus alvei]|uniref:hypothetical protein n=1 Tax=Paenibacillus alvei TaxID=44250 RepID=UPI0018CD261B|nr:hypothetical protein [Paenibacillus alvei]MBG9735279.1 hypothetical protein [Paenibacillus alvei]MBG9743736.1 hypothetical protein [Paenibacillus alvei]MCY9580168.1 hypothetical protein [Paenibacillus alvei]MCY9584343.1 hypothetical protein [Paenibacillus alvei]
MSRRIEVKGERSPYKTYVVEGGKVYLLEASVTIGAKAGKPTSVSLPPNKDDQKKIELTKEQGIALIKPVAKKLWGADVSSYTLRIDEAWRDYIFSSNGKPSIVARINEFGNLVSISLDPLKK